MRSFIVIIIFLYEIVCSETARRYFPQ